MVPFKETLIKKTVWICATGLGTNKNKFLICFSFTQRLSLPVWEIVQMSFQFEISNKFRRKKSGKKILRKCTFRLWHIILENWQAKNNTQVTSMHVIGWQLKNIERIIEGKDVLSLANRQALHRTRIFGYYSMTRSRIILMFLGDPPQANL